MQPVIHNKFFRKTASEGKSGGGVLGKVTGAAKETYENVSQLGWLGVPISAALVAAAAVKLLRPHAVAENSDKILLSGVKRTSLDQSKEDLKRILAQTDAVRKPKHDRFL